MEYETLHYDFSKLSEAIASLSYDNCNKKLALDCIKRELNLFFTDFKCTEVIYTENTDNEFFGVQISPMFPSIDDITFLFDPDNDVRFNHYLLEFDSRLFNGEFTARQIMALLIHDINKLNNPNLLKEMIFMLDHISMCKGLEVKPDHILLNKEFFLFTLQDTARKMTSAFEYIPADLSLSDDFIRSYELNKEYEDGMFGVKACRDNLKDQICSVTITMNWFVEKYINLSPLTHKDIVTDLKDAMNFTGSKLVRRILNQVIVNICTYKTNTDIRYYSAEDIRYCTALTESAKKKMSLAAQIKYSGLKSLEDDIYEYRMRIKNVETENDAIYIVRQINNRMGIISDYLETEELSDMERERFFKLYDKYDGLREELSKKAIYSRKMYGLFVDYNALQQMSNGSMTMNTYY